MSYDPTLVAPYKSGLMQYYKPFLIGNDAFVDLENCYSWRGNIRKREGSTVLGRLPIWNTITSITNASPPVVTTTTNHGLLTGDMVFLEIVETTNGTITGITPGITTLVTTTGAHGMSAGQTVVITGAVGITTVNPLITFNNTVFTIISVPAANQMVLNVETTGTWSAGGIVLLGALEKTAFQITVTGANTFTLKNLNTGVNVPASGVAISGNIYLPIVGTRTFILTTTGNEQLVVFHPKQAFLFIVASQTFLNISFNTAMTAITWAGTKDNFFYSSNYYSVMWATNNVFNTVAQPVGIRYYNGSTTAGWTDHQPLISGSTTFLNSALLILPYKGRLVVLNTTEGTDAAPTSQTNVNFFNRARWSQVGTPFAGNTNFGAKGSALITGVGIGVSPETITTSGAHGFASGQKVGIANIVGSVGNLLNGNTYTITFTGANTFTIPVDTSGLVYTSGGVAQIVSAPPNASPDINAWRDDIPGKGGYIDADTSERIVSAEVIQDTLIVGFQFSTWRLRYTGNEILPFIWERINTQFGSEATFSAVPFDDRVLMISRRGIVGATFNDVDRVDLAVPDFVDIFETGSIGEGLNRIQGVRDYQKRLVYWIYGDEAENAQTPNQVLCFNYQDNTWSTFNQSFTTLGNYKKTVDNTWATWTTIWDSDFSTWNTPLDQMNTIVIVAGAKDSRVWQIMNSDISTDDGVSYNMVITTNLINPYFQQGKRCKLAFYDLYVTNTVNGQITLENYTDDDPTDPWLIKTIDTNDQAISLNQVKTVKYIRVFLGMVARNHQITLTLSPTQLASTSIGPSDFELQGIIFHTRMEGRIKQ